MAWLAKSPSDHKGGYFEVKSFNNGKGFYVCCGKRIVRSYEYDDAQYSRIRAEELCDMLNEELTFMNEKYKTREDAAEARKIKQRVYSMRYYKTHKKESALRCAKWRLEHPDYYKNYRKSKKDL